MNGRYPVRHGFGYVPQGIPDDISNRRGAGDMANDPVRMIQLNPNDPDYQKRLFEIMARNLEILGSMRIINRGITTRLVQIGTQATPIVTSTIPSAITIINPTPSVGITSSATLYTPGTIFNLTGDSHLTPIGVANYDSLHFFINVTAITPGATFNIVAQVMDELTGVWVDVQDIVPAGITAAGNYYGFFSGFGVCSNFAIRWTDNGGGGNLVASMGYTLKNGLGGSSLGSANTVFIGSAGVTPFGGYPILEGQYRDFNMRENVELYGVTGGTIVNINIIEFN